MKLIEAIIGIILAPLMVLFGTACALGVFLMVVLLVAASLIMTPVMLAICLLKK